MPSSLHSLIRELGSIRDSIAQTDTDGSAFVDTLPEQQRASARNLLHYLALRRHDLRRVQPVLASHGLSSLGRTESHVRSSVDTVLLALHALAGTACEPGPTLGALTVETGETLLTAHTDALLGPQPHGRTVRIMVTMPSEAGHDYALVRYLLAAGMDCMRINCAHDDPATWDRMIQHLRRATRELRRSSRSSRAETRWGMSRNRR